MDCEATKTQESVTTMTITPETKELNVDIDIAKEPLFHDGGLRGWLIVAGSWLNLFATLGNLYSFGVYQDYYTRIFLSAHSPSNIAWIGSLQLTLAFTLGIVAGRFFDAGHVRLTLLTGSILFAFSLFMVSLVQKDHYYQVLLSQGLGMGLGAGLVFTPSTAIVSLHFRRRRILAYGTALTGISFGAIVFPITLNNLIPRIGFGSSVRITGYISLGCLAVGNSLIRPRPTLKMGSSEPPVIKIFFRDPPYVWFLASATVGMLGIFFPLVYLQLYAVEHAIDRTLAFYSLAIISGAGVAGRIIANHLADSYGVWNIQAPFSFISGIMIVATLGINSAASLIVVSILYGFFSSAWLSLTLAGLATLAKSPQEVGARVGVGLAVGSTGLLGSAPIQGALLGTASSGFNWVRPIIYSASLLFVASGMSGVVRMLISKRKGTQWV